MPFIRGKAGERGRQRWRADCRHCQVLDGFRAAKDAREALRESGRFMQYEDDEFDAEHPPPRLRDWLVAKAEEWRDPSG